MGYKDYQRILGFGEYGQFYLNLVGYKAPVLDNSWKAVEVLSELSGI